MFDRLIVNIEKRVIRYKIKKAKELIKENRIIRAEKEYKEILQNYKAFCRRATYLEKISVYHNMLYLYNELKKRRRKEERPMAVKKEAGVKRKKKKKAKKSRKRKKKAGKKRIKKKKGMEEEAKVKKQVGVQKETGPAVKPVKKGQLRTALDDLYSFVQKEGNVTIMQAASKFKVTRDKIEEWAKILDDHSLIKIFYPAFTGPQLRSLNWIKKQEERKKMEKEKKKKARKKPEEKEKQK